MQNSLLKVYLLQQFDEALRVAPLIDAEANSEHLHKLRVIVRRLRSLMSLFLRDSYIFTSVLKRLIDQTNELRELDALLSSLEATKYPQLRKKFSSYRDRRFKKIWTPAFRSSVLEKLTLLKEELDAFLSEKEDRKWLKITVKIYLRESFEMLEKLTPKDSHKKMHKMRIRFKILRYALEFMHESGIKNYAQMIVKCKKIQDHFGMIQDSANQLDLLKHFCEKNRCRECEALIKERKESLKRFKKGLEKGSYDS